MAVRDPAETIFGGGPKRAITLARQVKHPPATRILSAQLQVPDLAGMKIGNPATKQCRPDAAVGVYDESCAGPTSQVLPANLLTHLAGDRHRGGGHPPTPATPPCVRVRTRRFETVTLTLLEQCRKTERFEVRIRKPHRESLRPG